MYCRHCGKQIALEANYCPFCGKFIGDQKELGDLGEEEILVGGRDPAVISNEDKNAGIVSKTTTATDRTFEEEEKFKVYTFIGKNQEYYKRKWEGVHDPKSHTGWNWVSFFLPPFWFGYRKMYGWLFAYWGFSLLISILGIVLMKYRSAGIGILDLVSLAVAILLGIFGNALYYRFVKRRVAHISSVTPTELLYLELSRKGGTSAGGVWAAIGLTFLTSIVTLILAIVMFVNIPDEYRTVLPPVVNQTHTSAMAFGTGWTDQDITGATNTFSQGQAIYLSTDFDRPIGTTTFTVYLFKDQGSSKKVIVNRTEKINPKWAGLLYNLYDPDIDDFTLKPGHYTVQIIAKKTLESEGHFAVQGLPKGTSY